MQRKCLRGVVHQNSIWPGVARRRSARSARHDVGAVDWHLPGIAEPTTTSARKEIGSTDLRLSAIGIYAAAVQVYW